MATQSTPTATLRITRRLEAPREKVFDAWTRPEALKQWFCHEGYSTLAAEADARPGGRYLMRMLKDGETEPFHVEGTYREVRRPERLVFTWKWSHRPEMNDTVVTLDLTDAGGATEISIVHELFDTEELRDEHGIGWGKVLDSLTSHLA
jgi:uncharacterized protein YndB with AHSA1/START domain